MDCSLPTVHVGLLMIVINIERYQPSLIFPRKHSEIRVSRVLKVDIFGSLGLTHREKFSPP